DPLLSPPPAPPALYTLSLHDALPILRHKDQVRRMIHSTQDHFGRIDVLINNAAFGFYGSVESTPAEVVREIFDLNFDAALLASRSEEHTSELQSRFDLVCRLLLEKKK